MLRKMHVLAFRHVPFEDVGLIAPALAARGIDIVYADAFRSTEAQPDWQSAAGLLFMGGPMSANDDLPYIRRELAILEAAVAAQRPVLGVCLGAQLLARALGARITRNPVKEIGWAPVCWTEAARQDPLFAGLPSPATVFHWHGETFDLPEGARLLASSDACENQAFRFGSTVYGLQFHVEVTPGMISAWCREDANSGDVRELQAPIDPGAHAVALAELASKVFGAWAGLIAHGPAEAPLGARLPSGSA
jgi:GMP synthase (glutamine-hydrolysing)